MSIEPSLSPPRPAATTAGSRGHAAPTSNDGMQAAGASHRPLAPRCPPPLYSFAPPSEVRSSLKARRDAFNASDAAREAALDEAVGAVTRGSGEAQLDARVAEALARLDAIETGYR